MEYSTLGATGLRVSVAGLGCGGNSRVGAGRGRDEADSIALVREALRLGVTFFDTAYGYGTEGILGRAIGRSERAEVVIATKGHAFRDDLPIPVTEVIANLDESLRRLRTDHVDVFMVHAVRPQDYDHVRHAVLPALLDEKQKGKISHIGLSESPPNDPDQRMLQQAIPSGAWEVVMVGYHMLHQAPRRTVFPLTQRYGVGTLAMFAVRNIFSRPERLRLALEKLVDTGEAPPELAISPDPLGFLIREAGATSLPDAAYRFARHEPGVDVVLFGTSSLEHLRDNVRSILSAPLPAADLQRLDEEFGHLRGVGLDKTDRSVQRASLRRDER